MTGYDQINAEVVAVYPDKVKISVDNLEDFQIAEEKLKIGSYLQIADNENVILIAVIQNFLIEVGDERKYVIEANPLGTLIDEEFERGGDSLAIPPKEVKPAKMEDIRAIYNSNIPVKQRFYFSQLAQDNSINVPVNGNKFFNKHISIVGSTGSGKSHTVSRIIQSATDIKNDKYHGLNNSHIIIFDIHSEYSSAFPNSNILSINDLVLPYWLLNSEEIEELFLESGDKNNYNQASVLRNTIIANKKKKNPQHSKVYFDSPLNFDIDEVLNCLYNLKNETKSSDNELDIKIKNEEIKFKSNDEKLEFYFEQKFDFEPTKRGSINKGVYADGTLDKFVSRFENKIKNERLRFLFGERSKSISFDETLQQLLGYKEKNESNVTVIDLSGIPFEVLSITVSLISRLLFEYGYFYKKTMRENSTPLLLVYEEAHKYVPKSDLVKYRSSKTSIERIAKEGRKYGVTLLIASQRPSEISETIFSQCSNFIAMRLTNPDDQGYVKKLLPDTLGDLTDSLPSLKTGEGLLIGDSIDIPSLVKINPCELSPSSNDIEYMDIWSEKWKGVKFNELVTKWNE